MMKMAAVHTAGRRRDAHMVQLPTEDLYFTLYKTFDEFTMECCVL